MKPNGNLSLTCRGVSHWYQDNEKRQRILHNIDLNITRGQIVALVGQSGAGKSTLLNLILGTIRPKQGVITVHGADGSFRNVMEPGPDRGVVYQNYSLFPYLTTVDNVLMGLDYEQNDSPWAKLFRRPELKKRRIADRDAAVALLERVKLKDALGKYPHELSGGMRQRVAIAQALIKKPEILLLDEPFGAVDEVTRRELQYLLRKLNNENGFTILVVTHELEEAILVSHRVVALSQFWSWKKGNHQEYPGATIVYDQESRVSLEQRVSHFKELAQQRAELSQAAFEPMEDARRRALSHEPSANKEQAPSVASVEFDLLAAPKLQISYDGSKPKKILG